jgi:hypothetical protein
MTEFRCDVCACFSETTENGRQLPYGASLLEVDGTLSSICRDCFDVYLPLSPDARKIRWPVTLMDASLMRDNSAIAAWLPTRRESLRVLAAHHVDVCSPGFVIGHRFVANDDPVMTLGQGCLSGFGAMIESGLVVRDQLFLDQWVDCNGDRSGFQPSASRCKKCTICRRRESTRGDYKVCGRCKITYYCGVGCQTNDWPTHKKHCVKKLAAAE